MTTRVRPTRRTGLIGCSWTSSCPGLDGITATGHIKAAFPDARIVIVTDYGDEPLRAAAEDAGACGYVLKEQLLDVRRWLVAPCQTPNG